MVEQGIANGLHAGAQVYVSWRGEPVADFAVGNAAPDVPMTSETLVAWTCCSKLSLLVGLARLWEQGRLGIDDRIVDHLPEFDGHEKHRITLRHLLTHTSGFIRDPAEPVLLESDAAVWKTICDAAPEFEAGRRAAYLPWAGWFTLGEVIRRVDGRAPAAFERDMVFAPLGLDAGLDVSGTTCGQSMSAMYESSGGRLVPIPAFDELLSRPWPGISARGTVRDLAKLLEILVFDDLQGGHRILGRQTVEAITAVHRVRMADERWGGVVNFGLGVMADAEVFGRFCGPRTFGHLGMQTSVVMADPEAELVFAAFVNGMPGITVATIRRLGLTAAVYRDLGLAHSDP